MKLLCTADLHLVPAYRDGVLQIFAKEIRNHRPDALVVAGDLATSALAGPALQGLRAIFPDGQIVVTLGNHDFWVNGNHAFGSIEEVIEQCWLPAAQDYAVRLLDREVVWIDDLPVVGGYGHYDYGFAWPDLRSNDHLVAAEDYDNGVPPWPAKLRWRDFDQFPTGSNTPDLATAQVLGVEERLLHIRGSALVFLHTPPLAELLGVSRPGSTGWLVTQEQRDHAFFRAYFGNRGMGEMLGKHRERIQAVICGHTHRRVEPMQLNGFWGANVGSDYGRPRFLLLEAERGRVVADRSIR